MCWGSVAGQGSGEDASGHMLISSTASSTQSTFPITPPFYMGLVTSGASGATLIDAGGCALCRRWLTPLLSCYHLPT